MTDMLRDRFAPKGVYLDSATYGLPPTAAVQELLALTAEWSAGTYDPAAADAAVQSARSGFARMHGVPASAVAIGHQVSPLLAPIAASLGRANVLAVQGDFTSLLYPFVAAGCDVRTVALEQLAQQIDSRTDLVAVSAVQSADGRLADLDAIASATQSHGALTLIDATQACGWLPLDASRFDVVVTGGYKWLCHPRGTAFATISEALHEWIRPVAAGWYAAEQPWESCYGLPMRLASDARRYDVSPAWLSWHAAAVAVALFEAVGIERVHRHNVALANRLRAGLGMEASDSAIVSLQARGDAQQRLAAAGVKASVRAGRVRLSCHLYNDERDIDHALEALSNRRAVTFA
jgi:selenocysteine lyase/cysteine desulfurase